MCFRLQIGICTLILRWSLYKMSLSHHYNNQCKNKFMLLNAPKCNVISFTRNKIIIANVALKKVSTMRDLDVTLGSKTSLNNNHTEKMVNNARRTLAFFVNRRTKEFLQILTLDREEILMYFHETLLKFVKYGNMDTIYIK